MQHDDGHSTGHTKEASMDTSLEHHQAKPAH